VIVLGVVLIVLGVGLSDSGDGSEVPQTADEVIARQWAEEPARFTVSLSGDLLIHSPVYERALALGGGSYDFAPLLEQVRPYVQDADLAVCHVETPMTPGPPQGYPVFNTPPELAKAIEQTGWEACDTASNHSLDGGQEGVDATLEALDRAGIEHTGSYASAKASRKPLILGVRGVRIAYLAYTTDTNGIPLPQPWTLDLAKPKRILADAERASRRADVVIVNLHWGIDVVPEYTTEPSSKQRALVKQLTDSPHITAVVGQGPHVAQSIDRVDGRYVVFSEGNLISAQGPDAGLSAESQEGLIALLDFVVDGDGARVESIRYVPVWVQHPDYTVLPAGPALDKGDGDAASLRAAYDSIVEIAGRQAGVEPDPAKLP